MSITSMIIGSVVTYVITTEKGKKLANNLVNKVFDEGKKQVKNLLNKSSSTKENKIDELEDL